MEYHNHHEKYVPMLEHPHSKEEIFCLHGISSISFPLFLSLSTTEKSLALSSVLTPMRYLHIDKIPPKALSSAG